MPSDKCRISNKQIHINWMSMPFSWVIYCPMTSKRTQRKKNIMRFLRFRVNEFLPEIVCQFARWAYSIHNSRQSIRSSSNGLNAECVVEGNDHRRASMHGHCVINCRLIYFLVCNTNHQLQPGPIKNADTIYSSPFGLPFHFVYRHGVHVVKSVDRRWCWMCRREKKQMKETTETNNHNTNT